MPDQDTLRIFVAMPGNMGEHATWRNTTEIKEYLLEPVREELANQLKRDIELYIEKDKLEGSPIYKSMYSEAWMADIYIADLTGNNPNVYLELGARWALKDAVTILISQDVTNLKFNVAGVRAFPYGDSPGELKEAISTIVTVAMNGIKRLEDPEDNFCDSPVREGAPIVTIPRAELTALQEQVESLQWLRGEDLLKAALEADDPDDRLRMLREVVKLNPALGQGQLLLGIELRKFGEYDPAIEHLKQAASLEPDCAACYRELGVAYNKAGQPDLGINALREAVRLDRGDAEALNNLGGALRRKGLANAPDEYDWAILEEARDSYDRAGEIEQMNSYAKVNVARLDLLLSRQDPARYDQALDDLIKLRNLCQWNYDTDPAPPDQKYWGGFDLADTYLLSGDVERGKLLYGQVRNDVTPEYQASVFSSVRGSLQYLLDADVLPDEVEEAVNLVLKLMERMLN